MYKIFDMRTCGLSHQFKGPVIVNLTIDYSYTPIIMTSITWAGPKCVQEAAAILGPQNRIQGRCEL